MEEIKVPAPEKTPYNQANFSIEVTFNALLNLSRGAGLALSPVMGLMYLPTEELAKDFQIACNNILLALVVDEKLIVIGPGGKRYWVGDKDIPG